MAADEQGTGRSPVPDDGIYGEVRAERERAHAKHGDTSMESFPVDDMNRFTILVEEVGEVGKEFNEARHDGRPVDLAALRKELVQTAAMALAWADAIEGDDRG
jgi:NTP pyrophosphatase (non-canonical NTP hydrolase)